MTTTAVKVGFRRLGGHVENTALFVQRLTAPWHDAGGGFVSLGRPGIMAEFTGARNEMEYPAALAGPHIERANRAGSTDAADDEEILIRDAGRIKTDVRLGIHIQARAKMDRTILAKAPDRLTGFRIERVEVIPDTGEKALFAIGFILPEDKAALPSAPGFALFGLNVPYPQLSTGGGIEGDDLAGGRGGLKHAADNQIVGLVLAFVAGVVGPCYFELSDVGPVDLLERRVKGACFVAQVGRPVDVARRRSGRRGEEERWDC